MDIYTTSRYASPETRKFAKSLAEGGSAYLARGKKTIEQLAQIARRRGGQCIFIIEEKAGKPAKIAEIRVLETGDWNWAGERACEQ